MRRPLRTARPAVFWGAVFNGIYIELHIIRKQAALCRRSGALRRRTEVLHRRPEALRRRTEALRRRSRVLRCRTGVLQRRPEAPCRRTEVLRCRSEVLRCRSRVLCRTVISAVSPVGNTAPPLGVLRCLLETSRHPPEALRRRRERCVPAGSPANAVFGVGPFGYGLQIVLSSR